MKRLILAAVVVVFGAMSAAALPTDRIDNDQDVIKDSVTIISQLVATAAYSQVDTPHLAGSWYLKVENLDTFNEVACAFDSLATIAAGGGNSVSIITKHASGWSGEKIFKRWAQNLKLYCKSLGANGFTSDLRVIQGR